MPIGNKTINYEVKKIDEVKGNSINNYEVHMEEINNYYESKKEIIKNNELGRFNEIIKENEAKKLKNNSDYLDKIFFLHILYYIIKIIFNDIIIKSMDNHINEPKYLKMVRLRKTHEQDKTNNNFEINITFINYITMIIIQHLIINIFIQCILNNRFNIFKFSLIILTFINYMKYNSNENPKIIIFLYIKLYNNKIIKSLLNNNRIIKKNNNNNQKLNNYTNSTNYCLCENTIINDNNEIKHRNNVPKIYLFNDEIDIIYEMCEFIKRKFKNDKRINRIIYYEKKLNLMIQKNLLILSI